VFVLALGLAIGLVLSLTGVVDVPADRFATAADEVIVRSGHRVIEALPVSVQHNRVLPEVIVLLAVAAPGLASWLLACCAGASIYLRRSLGVIAFIVGVGCFFVLPSHQALVLAAGLAIIGLFARIATSLFLAVPLVAASVALGVRQAIRVINNSAPGLSAASRTLNQISDVSSGIWHVVAIIIALAPLGLAALRLLRLPRSLKA
jgi:hypothetical protein